MKLRNSMRKALALMTAFVLLLSLVPFTAAAESMVATLELDTPLTVSGTYEDPALLYFTPEETALYVCWSSGVDCDPQFTLFEDETDEEIDYYDDAEDLQFRMVRELTAGVTYRLEMDARSDADPFTVTIRKGIVPTAVEILGAEDGVLNVTLDNEYRTVDVAVTPADADYILSLEWEDSSFGETYDEEFRVHKAGECTLTATVSGGASDAVTVKSVLPPAATAGDNTVLWEENEYGEAVQAFLFTAEETAEYAFALSGGDLLEYRRLALYTLMDDGLYYGGEVSGYDDPLCLYAALEAGKNYVVKLICNYAMEETAVLTVSKTVPATGMSFAEGDAAEVFYGDVEYFSLTPVFAPILASREEITWESSDEEVAVVEDGDVTVIGMGTATITAESESGLTATFALTVREPEAIVLDTDYTFEGTEISVYGHYTFTPTETAFYNVWFDYTGYAAMVAVLEGEEAIYTGSQPIRTVELTADVTYDVIVMTEVGETATLRLQKTPAAEGIELGDDFSVEITDWSWLEYELLPEGALDTAITFTSSDESVLLVDEYGDLTPVAPGTATITATLENGVSDTVTVTVKEPLEWNGVGTKHVILNPINPEKVYRLTVEEDGWYEFTTDGSCNAELVLFVQEEEGVWDIGDAESEGGEPLSLIVELFADEVYYVAIDADEELVAFDVTLQACEAPDDSVVEQPEEGIVLLDTTIAATVGDGVCPDYRIAEMENIWEARIEDETVVKEIDGMLIAVGVGTTTVTLVTDLDNTAEFTVTVTAADVIALDEPQTIVLDGGILGQGFAFTPATSGEYVFYTDGDEDTIVYLYDDEFNEINWDDDSAADYNAWLPETLTAGETYYVLFMLYDGQYGDPFTGAVAVPVPATSLEVVPDVDDYLFFEDGVYFVEKDRYVEFEVQFGPSGAAISEWLFSETDNEDVVATDGYDYVYAVERGAATITFTSENGLTATVKLQVIEPLLGDVNTDGVLDAADAALLLAHLQGKKDIGRRQYFAQMNDDEAIDMTDYILLLKSIDSTEFPGVGDVNGDGKTDSTDARLVLQYAVKKIDGSAIALATADVDGNGKVDSTDARLILQYAVKKITQFPIAK